jgi:hypothetical protein
VSSCAATASISFFSNLFIIHLEKTIQALLLFHHVAKAFKLSSSRIHILGVTNQRDIHKFSTILYISGYSFLEIAFAPVKLNIICL